MNFLVGKKTVLFNAAAMAVALMQHYGGPLPAVDPETFGMIVMAVNFVLRFVTKTPVFRG